MKNIIKRFYEAWGYLKNHPIFIERYELVKDMESSIFEDYLNIIPVKINPNTKEIDDDNSKNTEIKIWLEVGPYTERGIKTHDVYLDCGGNTFEEAIIELAKLVKKKYGDNKKVALKMVQRQYGSKEESNHCIK